MKKYLAYYQATGKVRSSFSCPESMLEKTLEGKPGCDALESVANPENVWVDLSDKSVQPKIDNPATLSGMTLSNLPLPCTVTMRGPTSAEAYVEQDGLTLDADVPGRYRVTVVADHPKYYDAEFEVDL